MIFPTRDSMSNEQNDDWEKNEDRQGLREEPELKSRCRAGIVFRRPPLDEGSFRTVHRRVRISHRLLPLSDTIIVRASPSSGITSETPSSVRFTFGFAKMKRHRTFESLWTSFRSDQSCIGAVSYTHLTLPTRDLVSISVVAVS